MPTHTWSWIQDIHPGMAIGQCDQFPDINIVPITDQGQLVRKRNIDITEGILRKFHHLSRPTVSRCTSTLNKLLVKVDRSLSSFARGSANYAIIHDQLMEHVAWQDPFRTVSNMNTRYLVIFATQIRSLSGNPPFNLLRGTDWRG
tara:strand:- start:101 stop:535 length:435 start_codon:yes stop_codon:yes gene_type:complete